MFCNSSGEKEDPGGGDSLSTGSLCAVGLLRCPRQGQCSFLRFSLFICPWSHCLYLTSGFVTGLLVFTVQLARPGRNALSLCSFTYLWSYDILTVFTSKRITHWVKRIRNKNNFFHINDNIASYCFFISHQMVLVVTAAYKLGDYCDRVSHHTQANMNTFLLITHLWNCEDEVKVHIYWTFLSYINNAALVFFCRRWFLASAQNRPFVFNTFCQEFIHNSLPH